MSPFWVVSISLQMTHPAPWRFWYPIFSSLHCQGPFFSITAVVNPWPLSSPDMAPLHTLNSILSLSLLSFSLTCLNICPEARIPLNGVSLLIHYTYHFFLSTTASSMLYFLLIRLKFHYSLSQWLPYSSHNFLVLFFLESNHWRTHSSAFSVVPITMCSGK